MFWFHDFHYLTVAYLIGGILKYIFFQNTRSGMVLHFGGIPIHLFLIPTYPH